MQRNGNSIVGYRLVTTDGEIGKVDEFYFDDETWTIHYMIVKLEEGMPRRSVLIAANTLVMDYGKPGVFSVPYTKNQILDSPSIAVDRPISREQENALYWYYGGDRYWKDGLCTGALRSSLLMTGFRVHAADGMCGSIFDLVLDDETWKLVCLVVEMQGSPDAKKVLIPLRHLLKLRWDDAELSLDETIADMERSELFNGAPLANHPLP